MRVLMMTQALDPADPVLGFTAAWVDALARHVDRVDVLCLRAVARTSASNVTVSAIGARGEASQGRRLIDFERAAWRRLSQADVVFSHMIPRFACCAGPLCAVAGRPIVLWYVHRQDSLELRVAAAFSRFVATAVPASLPFATRKLRVLGHGVDAGLFAPGPGGKPATPPTIVFVGRLAPIKHQATLVEAMARLARRHRDVRAVFVGGEGEDTTYGRELRLKVDRLELNDRISFAGALAPAGVLDWYRRATVAINLSPNGLFDKAAIEGMMTGTPTIVASDSFDGLLESSTRWLCVARPDDPAALANVIDRVLSLSAEARARSAMEIRERAIEAHSLDRFIPRLVSLLGTAADR
jgi:glycosyltransferase involved in cell wall biosynthesis